MITIKSRIDNVLAQIRDQAKQVGRDPEEVICLAVSKTRTVDEIRACAEAGISHIGESYVQEALAKQALLHDLRLIWHFIGPIQSNKTSEIARDFSWVHSIDRFKIAERLSRQRPEGLPDLNICIQINISDEATKSGVSPEEGLSLIKQILELPRIKVRGLMAIPAPTEDPKLQQAVFHRLKLLKEFYNAKLGLELDTLSMGMSQDYLAAITEGATILRLGTLIFGPRG